MDLPPEILSDLCRRMPIPDRVQWLYAGGVAAQTARTDPILRIAVENAYCHHIIICTAIAISIDYHLQEHYLMLWEKTSSGEIYYSEKLQFEAAKNGDDATIERICQIFNCEIACIEIISGAIEGGHDALMAKYLSTASQHPSFAELDEQGKPMGNTWLSHWARAAFKVGNLGLANAFLKEPCNLTVEFAITALEVGHRELVDKYMAAENTPYENDKKFFCAAAKFNCMWFFKKYQGLNVIAKIFVNDILFAAAEHGHVELIEFLIQQGVSVRLQIVTGALEGGHIELAWKYLDQTQTFQKSHKKWRAIALSAAVGGSKCVEIFELAMQRLETLGKSCRCFLADEVGNIPHTYIVYLMGCPCFLTRKKCKKRRKRMYARAFNSSLCHSDLDVVKLFWGFNFKGRGKSWPSNVYTPDKRNWHIQRWIGERIDEMIKSQFI